MLRKLLSLTGNNNYRLFKHSTRIKLFSTKQEPQATDAIPKETKRNKRVNEVVGKYNEEDVEKLLKAVNNYNFKELLDYDITKNRANKLLAHRMQNGLLKDIADIVSVENFGIKAAEKFYKSLLEEPKSLTNDLNKNHRVKTASFITPSMDAELGMNINSCIAVRIGVNSITWSKLEMSPEDSNYPCQLTHWQHHDISEKRLHIYDLIQRSIYICHQIPTADCYLFENPQMALASNNPGSVEQQNISIQKAQVTAMLGYALAIRNLQNEDLQTEDEEDNMGVPRRPGFFYVRRFLTARLFNHLVGTERVSSEQVVLDLMRTYYNHGNMEDNDLTKEDNKQLEGANTMLERSSNIRGNVQFAMEFREMFSKAPRYQREFLGQALLLNLTFIRLVLLQDPKSIAHVTRGGRNNNESYPS